MNFQNADMMERLEGLKAKHPGKSVSYKRVIYQDM